MTPLGQPNRNTALSVVQPDAKTTVVTRAATNPTRRMTTPGRVTTEVLALCATLEAFLVVTSRVLRSVDQTTDSGVAGALASHYDTRRG